MGTAQAAFARIDSAFDAVLGNSPRLVKVVDADAHEGPVYVAEEDALYFTTVPDRSEAGDPLVRIERIALDGYRFPLERDRVEVVRGDANAANGMALHPDGFLVVCEQGGRARDACLSRLDVGSGSREEIVTRWRGLALNSPNDAAVRSDGTVWFTDPGYGHLQGFRPDRQVGDFVYRYDPRTGRLSVVADSFDKPNGLAFSPDESVLYIADSGANQEAGSFHVGRPHHVMAYDVVGGRSLRGGRLFAVVGPGYPDGIKTDAEGRVYVSSGRGIAVFDPWGELLGEIVLPGAVNFAFGAPGSDVLFITTDDAVWAAVLGTKGA